MNCIPLCLKTVCEVFVGIARAACIAACLSNCVHAQLATDPEIIIDNVNGTNPPGRSGAPATFGPIGATATCHTNGAASTTIQWAANGLAGVPTNGSALAWIAAASGRRWSKITGQAANTITVEDSFNIPAGTPVDCAVGGKIADLTPTRLFVDAKSGWYYSIVASGTDYTMTAALAGSTAGVSAGTRRTVVRGSGGRPVLKWTTDVQGFGNASGANSWASFYFEGIDFVNTNGSHANSVAIDGTTAADFWVIRDCTFTGFRNVGFSNASSKSALLYNCEATSCTNGAFGTNNSQSVLYLGNYAHNNTGDGFGNTNNLLRQIILYNISANNSGKGFSWGGSGVMASLHNLAYSNTGATADGHALLGNYMYVGNLATDNGRNGENMPASSGQAATLDNSAYFNNAGGNYGAGATVGPNDTVANPSFLNAGAANWGLGSPLIGLGWPPKTLATGISSTTFTGTEPGPSQRLGSGGNFAY